MASLTNKAMTATPTSQSPLSGSSPALSPKRAPPRLLTQPLERRTQTLYHHHHQSRNDPMDIDQPDLVDDGASIDDDDDQDDDRVEDIDEEDDEDQAEIIRCICLYSDDDGNTIACDKCAVWQHMICVGVDPNNVPDLYRCEKCAPRPFDSEVRAVDALTNPNSPLSLKPLPILLFLEGKSATKSITCTGEK
ncbi:hypothetical protein DFJ77DRAFT_286917 [Powellomyces hirtus]|nr:hypothetical protein DFJ77DRAFT_286917 [Powellomyces hirtus]